MFDFDVISCIVNVFRKPFREKLEMPTSSQAMILRSADTRRYHPTTINYRCDPFANTGPSYRDFNVKLTPPNSCGNCERVQFDFSVFSNPERAIDGIEGVFAYDPVAKTYRWQIYSMSPKGRSEILTDNHDSGDHVFEETVGLDSGILQQSSEYSGHFTTPAVSFINNTSIDSRNDVQDVTQREEIYRINEAEYRRLEELGFRKRTTYTPGGSLVRIDKEETSPPKSPQRCFSESLDVKRVPKLSVKNLEKDAVLKPQKPASGDCFKPQAFVCNNSMRRRVLPTKQKSLLEEVKETVNWAKRVTPSTHYRSGLILNLNFAVCFSLRDSWKYDHTQVKDLVESQTQCKVRSLQFDPVSLRTCDRNVLDRWIVAFSSARNCAQVIEQGLSVNGDKLVVRAWDDIVREEQGDDWGYPCNFRLPSTKHNRVLRKFLHVH